MKKSFSKKLLCLLMAAALLILTGCECQTCGESCGCARCVDSVLRGVVSMGMRLAQLHNPPQKSDEKPAQQPVYESAPAPVVNVPPAEELPPTEEDELPLVPAFLGP